MLSSVSERISATEPKALARGLNPAVAPSARPSSSTCSTATRAMKASAGETITVSSTHPKRKARGRPKASRRNTYWPPARGSIAPSSAKTIAPVSAKIPPAIHRARIAPRDPAWATAVGVKKMPEPMIEPITSIVTSNGPSTGSSPGRGSGRDTMRGQSIHTARPRAASRVSGSPRGASWNDRGRPERAGPSCAIPATLARSESRWGAPAHGQAVNSRPSESDVVWFEVLAGSRYQSCTLTCWPGVGTLAGAAVAQ